MVGVTPEDLEMAYRLITTSPSYLSKWTKQELTSAAMALRFFVRVLPGGPKLLRRVADLASQAPREEAVRMGHAVKAIKRQDGVDASLYRLVEEEDPAATSTQAPGAGLGLGAPDASLIAGPSNNAATLGGNGTGSASNGHSGAEEDTTAGVSYSQIPSGQRGGGDARDGDNGSNTCGSSSSCNSSNSSLTHNSASVGSNRKVSDSSFANNCVRNTTPPPRCPPGGPDRGYRVGEVDAAGGPAVAQGGAVAATVRDQALGPGNKNKSTSEPTGTGGGTTRVCNRVWIGKVCNKEHTGCRFAHPSICGALNCRGCTAFHPPGRNRGNTKGGDRLGSGAPSKGRPKKGGGSSGATSKGRNHNNRNSGTGGRNSPTYSQLQERVASMKLQLSRERERGIRKELKELKEMTTTGGASNSNSTLNNGNSSNHSSDPTTGKVWWAKARARNEARDVGAYARAQPSQALVEAVVATVLAVMTDGQQKGGLGELYRC